MSNHGNRKIDQSEWDFREVDAEPLSLPDATFWEYARTSERMRVAIVRWLESKVGSKTVRQHIRSGVFLNDKVTKQNAKLRIAIRTSGMTKVGNVRLVILISKAPNDFPEPWQSRPGRYRHNPKYRRANLFPISTVAKGLKETGRSVEQFDEMYRDGSEFYLSIDWHRNSLKEILKDVAKQSGAEAKNHPEMIRGKTSQARIEPLKWLAAYRLKEAGHTYESAKNLVSPVNDYRIIPFYADKSGWSDAVRKAGEKLTQLEDADPWKSWLLFAHK